VAETKKDDEREKVKQRHAIKRSVHLYGMLIAALAVINIFLYVERGARLSLIVAVVAAVALVGYLLYARKLLRSL